MKDTLVILGSHPRTRAEFDTKRVDCDLWVFNEAVSNKTFPTASAVFQMHEQAIWRNPANRNDPGHFKWLSSQTETPVYMQDVYSEVPASIKYPLDEIIDRFKVKHFTSSVAYALALAGYLGTYKRVEIYGVEMETNTEYQYQRDGVTLWIGILLGLGIEVDAHIGMFDQLLYGYEGEVVLPYDTFDKRIEELLPLIKIQHDQYEAAARKTGAAVDRFIDGDMTAEITTALQVQFDLSKSLGLLVGAKSENMKYKKKADTMRDTSGEFFFSRQEFESAAKALGTKAADMQIDVNTMSGQGELIHREVMNAAKGSPKRVKALARYSALMKEYLQAHNKAMILTGSAKENFRYMERLDKSIRAAGGSKSEAAILEQMKAGSYA